MTTYKPSVKGSFAVAGVTVSIVAAWIAFLILLMFVFAAAIPSCHAATPIPAKDWVVDTTGTLTVDQVKDLKKGAIYLESGTQTVSAVLMVSKLVDETIDEYALRVAETWHPGAAGIDQAVVLVIAKENKVWSIKTSRNTGRTLTDAYTKAILKKMTQFLKENRGNFYGAISLFYREITPLVNALPEEKPTPTPVASAPEGFSAEFYAVLLVLAVLAAFGVWWWFDMQRKEAERLAKRDAELERQYRERQRREEQRHALNVSSFLGASALAGGSRTPPPPPPRKKTVAPSPPPHRPVRRDRDLVDEAVDIAADVAVAAVAASLFSSSSSSSRSREDDSPGFSRSGDDGPGFSMPDSSSSSSFDGGGSSGSFD